MLFRLSLVTVVVVTIPSVTLSAALNMELITLLNNDVPF